MRTVNYIMDLEEQIRRTKEFELERSKEKE
jgi:hypothetical protein